MLRKPQECEGCPLYGDGLGFVPDEIVEGAATLVLMQNPGEDEEQQGRPAVGKTGQMMNQKFLSRAGLVRGETVSVCNVLKCRALEPAKNGPRRIGDQRYKGTNKLKPGKPLNAAIQHCMAAHFRVPESVDLIVAQGALAVRALGLGVNVTTWRGYLAPGHYAVP